MPQSNTAPAIGSLSPGKIMVLTGLLGLSSCTAFNQPPVTVPLNSELIQATFGSYGVDVLHQSNRLRLSNLFSVHDNQQVTRTFAIVNFTDQLTPDLQAVHNRIVSGGSIGQTFHDAGYEIGKEPITLVKLEANQHLSPLYQKMNIESPVELAYHVYVFNVRRAEEWVPYARITEVHSPEHLTTEELEHTLNLPKKLSEPVSSGIDKARQNGFPELQTNGQAYLKQLVDYVNKVWSK